MNRIDLDPLGQKVLKREHIALAGVTYFRKTWDTGYVDIYSRIEEQAIPSRGLRRRPITQTEWDDLAATHPIIKDETP